MSTSFNRLPFLVSGATLGLLAVSLCSGAEETMGKHNVPIRWASSRAGDPSLAWTNDGKLKLTSSSHAGVSKISIYNKDTDSQRSLNSEGAGPFAWREDSALFAAVRHTENGANQIRFYDPKDGYVVMTSQLPSEIHNVTEIRWIPFSDNVVFTAENSQGRDVYFTDAGIVNRISNTHDVLGIRISSDGNQLTWARSRKLHQSVPDSVFTLDMNKCTVDLIEVAGKQE